MKLSFFIFVVSAIGACQPQQDAPVPIDNGWIAPTKTTIPDGFITATKALLGNGLADPRGGEFHKVTVMLGNAAGWSPENPRFEKTGYGWIMPNKEVVLIDGVKYPLKSDLGKANPADLIDTKSGVRQTFTQDGIEIEHATIALPALLLARGENALAEKCWEQVGAHEVDAVLNLYAQITYRYTMQVAQCMIEHNDAEAVPWAKKLALVSDIREKAGVNYGTDTSGWRFDPEIPKQILRDVTRRAQHPKPKFDPAANAKLAPQARIAGLIGALDEVGARQWSQPGGISWLNDPITNALSKEGAAAVPALLDAIESDDRMTRSVSYHRDFFPMRTIHPVRTAAYACLTAVWPSSATVRDEDPKARIAKLRELWKSSSNLTESERWLNVLRDDSGNFHTWLSAAQHLTDPLHVNRNGQGGMSVLPTKSKIMHGEELRARYGSEVTKLMIKRMEILTKIDEVKSSLQFFEFADGLSIGHCLALWDGKSSVPALKAATTRTLQMVEPWKKSMHEVHSSLTQPFAQVIADRSNFGDKTAAKDYAELLPNYGSDGFNAKPLLSAMWKSPNDAGIQSAGAELLARILDERGLTGKPSKAIGIHPLDDLLRAPMLLSPAFRSFLAEAIVLPKVLGTVSVNKDAVNGSIIYKFGTNGGGSMAVPKGIEVASNTGKDIPLTAGDLLAQMIATAKGAPGFLLSWPEEKKAAAKKDMEKWLKDSSVDWMAVVKANPFVHMDLD